MTDKFELGRVRAAGLSPFDINVLSTAMATAGEFPFYPERLKPETRDTVLGGMKSLIDRGLLEVDAVRSTEQRVMLRLTYNGRAVCARLEEMNAKSRVEVQMHGDTPEVAKS